MKTIEKKAEEYVGYVSGYYTTEQNQSMNDFIAGAKWQQERSYSEEEVIKLLTDFMNDDSNNSKEWFEQFKKK